MTTTTAWHAYNLEPSSPTAGSGRPSPLSAVLMAAASEALDLPEDLAPPPQPEGPSPDQFSSPDHDHASGTENIASPESQQQESHQQGDDASPTPPAPPPAEAPTATSAAAAGAADAPRRLQLSDFRRVRTLGTGTFARVVLVRPADPADAADPSKVYALKIMRKTSIIDLKQLDHVRHERRILGEVAGHPFITNLRATFSDREHLYLLLDYVPGGELFSYLRRHRRFEEDVARFYAAEIVLVLEYLHEQQDGVAYRDLKPENLLLDGEGHIKLVDFGFAKRLGRGSNTARTYTLCGTPEYIAPEVIRNTGHTTAVDWWALGVLIFEFLAGYPPFWDKNPIEIYRQATEEPVTFPTNPAISPEAQDIIRQLLEVDRSRRLGNISGGAARVKAHPFFRGTDWDGLLRRRTSGPIVPEVRYPGDARCFDIYPEDDAPGPAYTDEMAQRYDAEYFDDF